MNIWGYAKGEKNQIESILKGQYRGIRSSPGFPSCPDHSEKHRIFSILDVKNNAGIDLTETGAMIPASSVCGYIFAHPDACNFSVAAVGDEQVVDYASRKSMTPQATRKLLSETLNLTI
jgi:5-methyltetrahydrofolate--homocysteine methyltransferase